MQKKIKVGISNHHVHLTKEVYEKLFKEELTLRNKLHQIGEFASNQTVDIKCGDKELKNLRIIGPFRAYNQVEISASDARKLGVKPPVRKSGKIEGSIPVTIIGPEGSVSLNEGVIIANRHVHFSLEDAKNYNIVDDEPLYIKVNGEKSGILDAVAKVSANGYLELHIDTDDAFAFLLNNDDEVEVYTAKEDL